MRRIRLKLMIFILGGIAIALICVAYGQLKQKKLTPTYKLAQCEVRGTVVNVPDYIKLQINLFDAHVRGVGGLRVPPNTSRQTFAFPVACSAEEYGWYTLHYVYNRKCGVNSWSTHKTAFVPPDSHYGIHIIVRGENKVYTDPERDFSRLCTSGILLEEIKTDRPSYSFGDVVNLVFTTTVKGPVRYKRVSENANYVITVIAGGLSHEVKRDELTVWFRERKTVTVPIHHTYYSRGRNQIRLHVESSEYNFDSSVYCDIN